MFELIFEPNTEDEFEYRHAVYELRGFKIAEIVKRLNPQAQHLSSEDVQELEQRINEVQQMRERIKQTTMYQSLDTNQKKATLDGKLYPNRQLSERAAAAGFNPNLIEYAYAYLSAYTHGDALSVSQVKAAITNEQIDSYIRLSMGLVMMVLSNLIVNYARKFPEAKVIYDKYPDDARLVLLITSQASQSL